MRRFRTLYRRAGGHPILKGVKTVRLDDLKGKALTLDYRGVIPLLVVKQEGRNPYWEPDAGTAVWSLLPYGKGWISDPKPLKLKADESSWSSQPDLGQNCSFGVNSASSASTNSPGSIPNCRRPENRPSREERWLGPKARFPAIGGLPMAAECGSTTMEKRSRST